MNRLLTLAFAMAALLLPAVAGATVWDAATLAAIPPQHVGVAHYYSTDDSGLVLTVVQDRLGEGSMGSATVDGHLGLGLGQDGLSSRYLVLFNLPVPRLTLHFAALTAGVNQTESIGNLDALGTWSAAYQLLSSDSSAQLVQGSILPASTDGQGRLTIVPTSAAGLTGLAFTHFQPRDFGGMVITRIEVSAVPETARAAAWVLGLLVVGAAATPRRRQHSLPT